MLTILGAIFMLIDHIGVILFPQFRFLRVIGRLSFPLFAFGIARGVRYTSNFWRYFGRLFLAACISQPIYTLVFGALYGYNPLFTLAWGAVVLWLWQRDVPSKSLAILLLMFSVGADISYGWYGVCTIFVFGLYYGYKEICFVGQCILQGLYVLQHGMSIQIYSIFSFVLLPLDKKLNTPKYFFYVFYPAHLLALHAIKTVFF